MKTLTILAILITTGLQAQFSDGFTKVTILPGNILNITNEQDCPTAFNIRLPNLSFFTTSVVQPDSSIQIEINPCGKGQVWALINCTPGVEPQPQGIEFNSCLETLAVEEKINWTQSGNEITIRVPVAKVKDVFKKQYVEIILEDGSKRTVEFPLDNKVNGFYYYKLKL